jgi:Raf kinase inhibitor-like YbhB/YbcL family protein
MERIKVSSASFEQGGLIPKKFTCEGSNINPGISISNVPKKAKSLAMIMEDPDAPMGTWTHWVVWNMAVKGDIVENSGPGTQGINSSSRVGYIGPCPPSGTHRYFFRVYALDRKLDLAEGATRSDLEREMRGHIVADGELMGKYSKGR